MVIIALATPGGMEQIAIFNVTPLQHAMVMERVLRRVLAFVVQIIMDQTAPYIVPHRPAV